MLLGKEGRKEVREIIHGILRHEVSHFICVPPLYREIIGNMSAVETRSLKVVTLAGDKTPRDVITLTAEKNKSIEIVNEYGVTEAAVMSTIYRNQEKDEIIKVGGPIRNTKLFILDNRLKPRPMGVPGELCISGAGVARGYLNNPALTAERFVNMPSPTGEAKNIVLYRTGDLARWLLDGTIEFLGRIDRQVKIRGFRIELEEIEKQLLQLPNIKGAAVLDGAGRTGEKYICACIVSAIKQDSQKVLENLWKKLPAYMLPTSILEVEALPMTPNGKLDRNALWAMIGGDDLQPGVNYSAPRNETEKKLAELWAEVLDLEVAVDGEGTNVDIAVDKAGDKIVNKMAVRRVGIDDNFFSLGGHSLKATSLVFSIHQTFDVKLSLVDIFQNPTIGDQAALISESVSMNYTSAEPAEKRHYYPLSSLQKRLYILNKMGNVGTAYNLTHVLKVEGKLDVAKLERVYNNLCKRHESLRTSFEMPGAEPVQRVKDHVDFKINYCRLEDVKEQEKQSLHEWIKAFVHPFDLTIAPLLRVGVRETAPGEFMLVTDIHHIISDGTSITLLVDEALALYRGDELEPLDVQYKDFSMWQNGEAGRRVQEEQEAFWLDRLKSPLPELALFTDYERGEVQSFEGAIIDFKLEEAVKLEIQQLNRETGTTLYMVLLAVVNILFSGYTGQEDIIIGSPVAGRSHADYEKILGIFINALPMRNFPSGEKTFEQFLYEVKESTLQAYKNQDYSFTNLIERLGTAKELNRNLLFDAELVVQNMEFPELRMDDVIFRHYEPFTADISQVDIAFYVLEHVYEHGVEPDGSLLIHLVYCTALFKKETMERLIDSFRKILATVLQNRNTLLKDITIQHNFSEADSKMFSDEESDFDF